MPKQPPEHPGILSPGDCFGASPLATSMTFSAFPLDSYLSAPLRLCVKTLQRSKLDFPYDEFIDLQYFGALRDIWHGVG